MKKIYTSIIMALALVAAVSCNKATPDKSEVEAGFKAKQPVPSVTINPEITTDGVKATVTFTVSGITAETQDNLSVGVLSSTTPQFKETKFAALPKDEATGEYKNGTYTLDVPVSPNTTTYFRATAANFGGTKYSDSVIKEIPDVAFYLKVAGTYYAEETGYTNDTPYPRDITITINEDLKTCIIANIEPTYACNGYTYPNYNWVIGTLNEEKQAVVISNGSPLHLGSYFLIGLDAPTYDDAGGYADVVFTLQSNGNLLRTNAMGLASSAGLSQIYEGPITYSKR